MTEANTLSILPILKKIPLLEELNEEDHREIIKTINLEYYPANTIIFHEGDPGDAVYIIKRGLVRIYHAMKPAQLTKLTDIAVTLNPLQYAARTFPADSRILAALYEADIDYDLFDPTVTVSKKKIVFYSGNQWLPRRAHEHLRAYVEGLLRQLAPEPAR